MALIAVKNLGKTYFSDDVETPVLHDVNFKIEEGDFVAIMGPSGSGKSTLLHILGFLDDQTEGSYHFDGNQMSELNEEQIAYVRNNEMGFVFQSFNLLSRSTVYDNVQLPLLYSQVPEKDWNALTRKAIESVGMTHRIDYVPSQLSGGEKQRVAIARALVNNPKVIFADEPTGNLDSKSGRNVMEILQKLNQDLGHTVILITHESLTAEHAERVISIMDGTLLSDEKVKLRRFASQDFQK